MSYLKNLANPAADLQKRLSGSKLPSTYLATVLPGVFPQDALHPFSAIRPATVDANLANPIGDLGKRLSACKTSSTFSVAQSPTYTAAQPPVVAVPVIAQTPESRSRPSVVYDTLFVWKEMSAVMSRPQNLAIDPSRPYGYPRLKG